VLNSISSWMRTGASTQNARSRPPSLLVAVSCPSLPLASQRAPAGAPWPSQNRKFCGGRKGCGSLAVPSLPSPIQTPLIPAPVNSPGARAYSYQNQDVPRSGAGPGSTTASPQLSSCCFGDFLVANPTFTNRPAEETGLRFLCQRRFFKWRSRVLKLKPRLWQTRSAAYHCSQTPPLTAAPLLAAFAWMLTTYFLRSSSYLNTDTSSRTGGLVRRLRPDDIVTCGPSPRWSIFSAMSLRSNALAVPIDRASLLISL
jgi:hypothetical protein